MNFSRAMRMTLLALSLATPALSCVEFSAYQGLIKIGGPTKISIILEDKGATAGNGTEVTCTLAAAETDQYSRSFWPIPCPDGFGATFDSGTGTVTYWHGDFSGSFHVEGQGHNGGEGSAGGGVEWIGSAWGC